MTINEFIPTKRLRLKDFEILPSLLWPDWYKVAIMRFFATNLPEGTYSAWYGY